MALCNRGVRSILFRLAAFLAIAGASLASLGAGWRFALSSALATMLACHVRGRTAPRAWLLSFWCCFVLSPALSLGPRLVPGEPWRWLWSCLFVLSTWRISFALDPVCWPQRSLVHCLPPRPEGVAGLLRVVAAAGGIRTAEMLSSSSGWGSARLAGIPQFLLLLFALLTVLRIVAPVGVRPSI